MYKIVKKKMLTPTIFEMEIEAPRVAKSALPGQFIILRIDEKGERIPLTISDYDAEKGTVSIADFVGPLGCPSDLCSETPEELSKKNIIFVAGGVGAAPIYPQVKWLKQHGIKSDVLIGARNKDLLILVDEMKEVAENVYIATDDGTAGFAGRATDLLEDLVKNQGKEYNHAVVIGPMIMMKFTSMTTKALGIPTIVSLNPIMMKFVCLLTKKLAIPTVVSMNPIMVDGTGMCGACRVVVDGEVKFACVDGPEFDGHKVDYDGAMRRQTMYKTEEGQAKLKFEEGSTHKNGGCGCGGDK